MPIARLYEIRRPEGENDQEIDQQCVGDMDGEIDHVVPRHVEAAKMIIQGKGEISDKSARVIQVTLRARNEVVDVMNDRIFAYVADIVELEGDAERIEIRSETDGHHKKKMVWNFLHSLKIP